MTKQHAHSPSQGGRLVKTPGATTTAGSHSRPLRHAKLLSFLFIMGLGTYLACEIGAFFLHWLLTGTPFSWQQMQNQRLALLNETSEPGTNFVSEVHPHVGFVERPRPNSGIRRLADEKLIPVSSFGYVDDEEPIQARRSGRVIIAIMGGSVACQFAVNGSKRLGEELDKSPAFAGKELVVNLARNG